MTEFDQTIAHRRSPAPPASCNTPVLLIRNSPGGGWFAAGVQKFDDGN